MGAGELEGRVLRQWQGGAGAFPSVFFFSERLSSLVLFLYSWIGHGVVDVSGVVPIHISEAGNLHKALHKWILLSAISCGYIQ